MSADNDSIDQRAATDARGDAAAAPVGHDGGQSDAPGSGKPSSSEHAGDEREASSPAMPLKEHVLTVDLQQIGKQPLPAICHLLSLGYQLGATHGGAVATTEVRTNPLQPGKAQFVIGTDVPKDTMPLAELQQRLLGDYLCDDHPVDQPADDCDTCAARYLIAVTAPRTEPAIRMPDEDERERTAIRNQILTP